MRTGITSNVTYFFGSEATSKNQVYLRKCIQKHLKPIDTSCEQLVIVLNYLGKRTNWNVTGIIFRPNNTMDIFFYPNENSIGTTCAVNLIVNPEDFKIYKRETECEDGYETYLDI